MPPPKGSRFQIYLVGDAEASRRYLNAGNYRQINLKAECRDLTLYVHSGDKPPRWKDTLREILLDQNALNPLSNRTHSFVLYVSIGASTYAVCGGNGSLAIQKYTQSDFGLDIVARLIEPSRIRLKRQRGLTGEVAQVEEAYKGAYNFEIDPRNWGRITKELLGEASKIDMQAALGIEFDGRHRLKLHGKSGFAVNRSMTLEKLRLLIQAIERVREIEPKIRVLKGFKEVGSKADRQRLDRHLLQELQRQFAEFRAHPEEWAEGRIGISHPDMRDFLRCASFWITLGDIEVEHDDLELADLFTFLQDQEKEDVLESYLTRVQLSGEDEEGGTIFPDTPLRRMINAELEIGGERFLAMDGKWYRIGGDFVADVDRKLEQILAESQANYNVAALPRWGTENGKLKTEDFYIDNTCNGLDRIKFHRNHVVLDGPDRGELCDILDITNGRSKFLFLKKGSGIQLRELCSQARESTLLYLHDARFIQKAAEKIREQLAVPPGDVRTPIVVMLFSDHILNRGATHLKDRLGTMVKVELVDTYRFLRSQAEAKEVAICEIPHQ